MSSSAHALPRSPAASETNTTHRDRLRGLVRGRPSDPAWVRPALLGVLALSAVLCLWDLTIWALEHLLRRRRQGGQRELEGVVLRLARSRQLHHRRQAAAVAVADGPLGARPRLLVASASCSRRRCARSPPSALLFATVRRVFGPAAGLIAAAALAITPVTVAIGRVNNPDALLVLLMVGSAY